jgi:DNA-binding CsgD family transcriptional regulator
MHTAWKHLLSWFMIQRRPEVASCVLNENLQAALMDLARLEKRPAVEVQADLLFSALLQRSSDTELLRCWVALSPREQDVAALACLGYTNRQIAARLYVSPETVKGYMRQVLIKFELHSKVDLRVLLHHWDFRAWEAPHI